MPDASIYDLANLQQIQTGLSPLVAGPAAQAELNRELLLRQMVADQQLRNQTNVVRTHMGLALSNALAEQKDKDRLRQEELGRRNESIKVNVSELAQLEDQLQNTITADSVDRQNRIQAKVSADLFVNHPELAKLRDQLGVSDIRLLASRIQDVGKRSAILSEYQAGYEAALTNPKFSPDPATNARVSALAGRIRQLNEAIGKHVEVGGTLPSLTTGLAPAELHDWQNNVPPIGRNTQPAAAGDAASGFGTIADRARGAIGALVSPTRSDASDAVTGVSGIPSWAAVVDQAKEFLRRQSAVSSPTSGLSGFPSLYGSPQQQPYGPEPTPEQKAIMENQYLLQMGTPRVNPFNVPIDPNGAFPKFRE